MSLLSLLLGTAPKPVASLTAATIGQIAADPVKTKGRAPRLTKVCKGCGKELPVGEFPLKAGPASNDRRSRCRVCWNKYCLELKKARK